MRHGTRTLVAVAAVSLLAGCSGGSDSAADGTISVSLMDRPIDGVLEVNVTVSGMWIKPQGDGPAIVLLSPDDDPPIMVDLLELTADDPEVLVDQVSIPAGSYNWIEMQIDDSGTNEASVMDEFGAVHQVDVDVPSGRVRLVSGIEVGPNEGVHVLFDWDVRKGLTYAEGRDIPYMLHPAFRILDATEIVKISGTVYDLAANAESCDLNIGGDTVVVYVFDGMPANINDGIVEPAASTDATLRNTGNDGNEYSVALIPGTYTVAFACEAEGDAGVTYLQPKVVMESEFADAAVVTVDFDIVP